MSLKPSETTKFPRSSVDPVGCSDSLEPTNIALSTRLDEATFLAHYDWLTKWAGRLVLGTREDPDDLVQDLYVSMMMVRFSPKPTFADHDQIRAYLYKSLKNMLLSRLRRQRKDVVSGYPTVYFESMEFATAAADRSSLPFVRSELVAICEYACMRRNSSQVGSAFILRYFLGYRC
jgi:DNA-directed RNA polymerase specialized sigma24 family protein